MPRPAHRKKARKKLAKLTEGMACRGHETAVLRAAGGPWPDAPRDIEALIEIMARLRWLWPPVGKACRACNTDQEAGGS